MSKLLQYLTLSLGFIQQEHEANEEFKRRAEEARKKYWDACKYPRKTKKRMRKEAIADYNFYMQLSEPIIFSW